MWLAQGLLRTSRMTHRSHPSDRSWLLPIHSSRPPRRQGKSKHACFSLQEVSFATWGYARWLKCSRKNGSLWNASIAGRRHWQLDAWHAKLWRTCLTQAVLEPRNRSESNCCEVAAEASVELLLSLRKPSSLNLCLRLHDRSRHKE